MSERTKIWLGQLPTWIPTLTVAGMCCREVNHGDWSPLVDMMLQTPRTPGTNVWETDKRNLDNLDQTDTRCRSLTDGLLNPGKVTGMTSKMVILPGRNFDPGGRGVHSLTNSPWLLSEGRDMWHCSHCNEFRPLEGSPTETKCSLCVREEVSLNGSCPSRLLMSHLCEMFKRGVNISLRAPSCPEEQAAPEAWGVSGKVPIPPRMTEYETDSMLP